MSRGQIVRWALHEVKAPYETKIVQYGEEMKSAAYLGINPMGKVPAIEHEGQIVTECAAICVYLAQVFPDAKLGPTSQEAGDYYRWVFFAAGVLEPALMNKGLGLEPPADKSATVGYGSYDLTLNTLEAKLKASEYVCGSRFTMADVYLGAQVDFGLTFKTFDSRPAFESYAERMRARSCYQDAKKIDQALIAEQAGQ